MNPIASNGMPIVVSELIPLEADERDEDGNPTGKKVPVSHVVIDGTIYMHPDRFAELLKSGIEQAARGVK